MQTQLPRNRMRNGVNSRTLPSACLALLIVLVWGTSAQAQYKSIEPKAAARSAFSTVQNVWENPSRFQDEQARRDFDSYFKEYVFPAMTQSSSDGLRDLGRHRDTLLRMLQRPAANAQQVYTHLTNMVFQAMRTIATDNYHPAARYNAMLVIGELNQRPGDPRNENNPPVPHPDAADFMVQQLQSNSPDIVKLGALIGLERHAQFGLPDDKRQAATDELVTLVTSARPGDRTREGHAWLQFRAAMALAQMRALGENNRVHDALVNLMNNDNVPVGDRIYVANALQLLKDQYTPQAGIDASATLAALGNILADVMEEEEDEAYKFNEQQRSGGFAFGPYAMLDEEPPGYPRGRFLQRIIYVLNGFAAVENALPDELKQQLQAARAPLEQLRTVALDRTNEDVELTIMIENMSDQIMAAATDLGQTVDATPADADDSDLDDLGGLE